MPPVPSPEDFPVVDALSADGALEALVEELDDVDVASVGVVPGIVDVITSIDVEGCCGAVDGGVETTVEYITTTLEDGGGRVDVDDAGTNTVDDGGIDVVMTEAEENIVEEVVVESEVTDVLNEVEVVVSILVVSTLVALTM